MVTSLFQDLSRVVNILYEKKKASGNKFGSLQ